MTHTINQLKIAPGCASASDVSGLLKRIAELEAELREFREQRARCAMVDCTGPDEECLRHGGEEVKK